MPTSHRVAVLGGGSFGTVIANMVALNGSRVSLWLRNEIRAEAINSKRENSEYKALLVCQAERGWAADGDHDFRIHGSLAKPLVGHLSNGIDVQKKAVVKRVVHTGGSPSVELADGTVLQGSAVVVAVPIPPIRDGEIVFSPDLPHSKMQACRDIQVQPALKVQPSKSFSSAYSLSSSSSPPLCLPSTNTPACVEGARQVQP